MLNCVFCRVSGFPHGVEGQFGLQGGVGVSRRVWGATYSRRWERANSMKLSQCRGGPPGDAARGGRAAWKSVKKRPRKRTPTKSGRYSEGHPRKGPKSGSSQGAKPPLREGKRRKTKTISYNVGNSIQIHRAAITADEREERNAQATMTIRLKAQATWSDPARRGIKESLRFGE